jgi:hypothetical protein
MNAKLTSRMEIAFWDLFIYNLSEKEWMRRLVRLGYRCMPAKTVSDSIKMLAVVAASGFASGILFYVVLASHL